MKNGPRKELFLRIRFRDREAVGDLLRSLWPDHQLHIRGSSLQGDGDHWLINWEMRTTAHAPVLLEFARSHPAVLELQELPQSTFEKMFCETFARNRVLAPRHSDLPE